MKNQIKKNEDITNNRKWKGKVKYNNINKWQNIGVS